MADPVNRSLRKPNVRLDSESDSDKETDAASSGSDYGATGRIQPAPSGMPPAMNATSTTHGARLQNAPHGQPAPTGNAVAASPPVYSTATGAPSARELALRASAIQTRAAMASKDPLKALKKIFKDTDAVRLEVPRLVFPGPPADFYWKFSERHWLKQIHLNYLHLKFASFPGEPAVDLTGHMDFLIELLKNCNGLPEKSSSRLRLSIDVSLQGSSPGHYLATELELKQKRLFLLLETDKVMIRLSLCGIKSTWLSAYTLSDYFPSLANHTRLEELDLSRAELSDSDACGLAAALMQNRSIKTIDLSECVIPEKGRDALADVFSKKPLSR